jgi:Holliday junction resolvase-like predicted endonuclease
MPAGTDTLHDRAIEAARAYLRRAGFTEIEDAEADAPFALVARDGGSVVFVLVKTRRSGTPIEIPAPSAAAMRRYRKYAAPWAGQFDQMRVDVIGLRVLGADRALLRHNRGYTALDA